MSDMTTIDKELDEAINKYKYDFEKNYSREKSWNLCYEAFRQFRRMKRIGEEEKKNASLELCAYLASFGMYRNSALLAINYMGFLEIMPILFDKKYYCLDSLDVEVCCNNISIVCELKEDLKREMNRIKEKSHGSKGITDTLVSKIIMGAYGCTVAYDDNVRKALSELRQKEIVKFTSFRHESLEELYNLYNSNIVNKEFVKGDSLTPMRKIDICLWYYGDKLNRDAKKGKVV